MGPSTRSISLRQARSLLSLSSGVLWWSASAGCNPVVSPPRVHWKSWPDRSARSRRLSRLVSG
jgi:hypothetical protein